MYDHRMPNNPNDPSLTPGVVMDEDVDIIDNVEYAFTRRAQHKSASAARSSRPPNASDKFVRSPHIVREPGHSTLPKHPLNTR